MYNIILITCMLIIIITSNFFLIVKKKKKYRQLKKLIKSKNTTINCLYDKLDKISFENNSLINRVKYLEDIKSDAFQVKLRNEIVQINIDFTKLEMVIILAGVSELLKKTKNLEDAKIYISLIEKINGFINNMKEENQPEEAS